MPLRAQTYGEGDPLPRPLLLRASLGAALPGDQFRIAASPGAVASADIGWQPFRRFIVVGGVDAAAFAFSESKAQTAFAPLADTSTRIVRGFENIAATAYTARLEVHFRFNPVATEDAAYILAGVAHTWAQRENVDLLRENTLVAQLPAVQATGLGYTLGGGFDVYLNKAGSVSLTVEGRMLASSLSDLGSGSVATSFRMGLCFRFETGYPWPPVQQ